jgi:hypothetical protein
MGRRIGADALEPDQIVVAEPAVPALAVRADRAVLEHPAGRRVERRGAEAEPGALAQPRLAIVEDHAGFRKRTAARFGHQRRRHAAGAGPAGVDRQHGLDEVLVEGRAAQHAAAAVRDQRGRLRQHGPQGGDRRRRIPSGGQPAADAAQDLGSIGRGETVPADAHAGEIGLPDRDRAEPAAEAFAAREGRAVGVPVPRREMDPAVARRGQAQIERPAEAERRLAGMHSRRPPRWASRIRTNRIAPPLRRHRAPVRDRRGCRPRARCRSTGGHSRR